VWREMQPKLPPHRHIAALLLLLFKMTNISIVLHDGFTEEYRSEISRAIGDPAVDEIHLFRGVVGLELAYGLRVLSTLHRDFCFTFKECGINRGG